MVLKINVKSDQWFRTSGNVHYWYVLDITHRRARGEHTWSWHVNMIKYVPHFPSYSLSSILQSHGFKIHECSVLFGITFELLPIEVFRCNTSGGGSGVILEGFWMFTNRVAYTWKWSACTLSSRDYRDEPHLVEQTLRCPLRHPFSNYLRIIAPLCVLP